MTDRIDELRARIAALQDQLEREYGARRARLLHRIENGRVVWEDGVRRSHLALRQRIPAFLLDSSIRYTITAPVIYALIIPFALLDLFVSIYQAICFPAYRIPKVRRRDYIRIDRHQLAYLNWIQKLNCVYCGYCNGLIAYVREISARTEAFWCPIKHAMRTRGLHPYHAAFSAYGDGVHFREDWEASRARMQALNCEALNCDKCGGGDAT
ncbi:MAG: hypothetical protein GYB53_10490 [Rhodobacteraceae bacterium]|nr:hypothetical protein [Paracoccaceae bacterium]MBR9820256.1 hypothetical protein [Paracoccaceae bacterium]